MKEFGKRHFKNTAYISFDSSPKLNEALETTIYPAEFLPILQSETETPITPDTLIVFDEIQESPRALLSLKYFRETAPEYSVIAAGSTLGVMIHKHASFPVGKVEFLDVYPLSFFEFINAAGNAHLLDYIKQNPPEKYRQFHDRLCRLLRIYLYVGGMPGVINEYLKNGDYGKVRKVQKDILAAYDRDFSKHAKETFSSKLRMLWHSIPEQLARESKKFTYGAVKSGARGRDFEVAIQWMQDSSLVQKVTRVGTPKLPLKFYEGFAAFKLYINDVGLLGAMVKLKPTLIADKDAIFAEFKGALAEQFVFQELRLSLNENIYYWSNENGDAEVDFLTEDANSNVIPVEVKSGINLRSKSLRVFIEKFAPKYSIRTSLTDYKVTQPENIIDMPLYAVANVRNILDQANPARP
jgi:hypothetical protein